MNLLTFSQQPIRPDQPSDPVPTPAAKPPASPDDRFPLTIVYPANAKIAVPATWRRLPTGQIEAIYHDYDELYWSVTISKCFHIWAAEPSRPPEQGPPEQTSLPLCGPSNHYYRKG